MGHVAGCEPPAGRAKGRRIALRAVLVYEPRGAQLGPIRSSDDRAVTFFIDAPTLAELDEIEERVRRAVTIHTSVT